MQLPGQWPNYSDRLQSTNFLKAKAAFKNEDKDRRDEEAKVCHLILSSLSDEAQMHFRSVVAFTKASVDNDSYAMFTIAKDEHSRSSSFAVAQSTFQQLLNIKKTGTFVALIHDLTDHRRKFCAIFDLVPGNELLLNLSQNSLTIYKTFKTSISKSRKQLLSLTMKKAHAVLQYHSADPTQPS